jgi:hypothetical protein
MVFLWHSMQSYLVPRLFESQLALPKHELNTFSGPLYVIAFAVLSPDILLAVTLVVESCEVGVHSREPILSTLTAFSVDQHTRAPSGVRRPPSYETNIFIDHL